MDLIYKSTRDNKVAVTASQAILKGLSEDGGLFMPAQIPELDLSMKDMVNMSYQEIAYEVMKLFLTDFTEEELKNCIRCAYDEKFDTRGDRTAGQGGGCLLSGAVPRRYHRI